MVRATISLTDMFVICLVLFNNEMNDFTVDLNAPNAFGLVQSENNNVGT